MPVTEQHLYYYGQKNDVGWVQSTEAYARGDRRGLQPQWLHDSPQLTLL